MFLGIGAVIFGSLSLILSVMVLLSGLNAEGIQKAYSFGVSQKTVVLLVWIVLIWSILFMTGGYGLLKKRSWARGLLILLSVLSLLNFPIGTVLGIFFLIFLGRKTNAGGA